MDLQLRDKTVLITGSTRGLGFAIARSFLREGAKVIITGRKQSGINDALKNLSAEFTPDVLYYFTGNMTQASTIQKSMKQIARQFGHLDILIANLGDSRGDLGWQVSDKVWQEFLTTNLLGAVRMSTAIVPLMKRSLHGSIVFISSITGCERVGGPLPYGSAKAALQHFAKDLATQLAPERIRVNTVAPGNILTDGGVWEAHLKRNKKKVQNYLQREVPLGRLSRPEEIADVVTFVASPKASFMTGSCVVIDGGQTRSL